MARNTTSGPDPEDMRKDLLAALAAGRELGPEMDAAIVDAHLRRHYGAAADKPKPPAVVERRPLDLSPLVMPLSLMVGLVAYLAVLYFSQGHLWFLFWPLLGWGWWGWGRGGRSSHLSRRTRRWDRDGYALDDGDAGSTGAASRQIVTRHEIV